MIVGWDEVGDLRRYRTWEELKAGIRRAYPEASTTVVGNWAGQLWKFGTEIVEGDLVVMPLKGPAGVVAIGRVAGEYEVSGAGARVVSAGSPGGVGAYRCAVGGYPV